MTVIVVVALERLGSASHWSRESWAVEPALGDAAISGGGVWGAVVVLIEAHNGRTELG